jgi:hypothetical protein
MSIATIALALTAALVPSFGFAECVVLSLRDSIKPATVAFSGTTTAIVLTTASASEWPGTTMTFDVDRVWKGPVTKRIVVHSFTRSAEGMNFTVGKTYIVFAHSPTTEERQYLRLKANEGVVVGQCGDGTREIALLSADLTNELGPGQIPIR